MHLKVSEIFFSYQGEGKYLGLPTIFIRFSGCNMQCFYCDTKYSSYKAKKYKLTTVKKIIEKVSLLKEKYNPIFVSLTGGEPLLQRNLDILVKELKKLNLKIYLETNSTLPEKLEEVIRHIDIVCANFKIKNILIKNFIKVINICKKNKTEFFIKIVVTDEKYTKNIIDKIFNLFNQNKCKTLILQPESCKYRYRDKKLFSNLSLWYQKLSPVFKFVQIIPQVHKFVWKVK